MQRRGLKHKQPDVERRVGRRRQAVALVLATVVVPVVVAATVPVRRAGASTSTVILTAAADAEVNAANPARNYGAANLMAVCAECENDGSTAKRAYLRFDISAVHGRVTGTTLRLTARTAPIPALELTTTSPIWDESIVTWKNAPPMGGVLGGSPPRPTVGKVDFTLGSLGTGAFVVASRSSAALRLAARESSSPPQLIVTIEDGPPPPGRPNVLVINTDDQREWSETLSAMPKTRAWIEQAGRNYTNAYVTTPSCCPSRSSFFTGQYVHNHGVKSNAGAEGLDQKATLQRYLTASGYVTAMAGKYLNAWPIRTPLPYFNRYARVQGGYSNGWWLIDGHLQQRPEYTTTFIGQKAVDYLDEFEVANDDQPWYLYLAPLAPHTPTIPEEQYANAPVPPWPGNPAVNEDLSDKPWYLRRHEPVADATIQTMRTATLRTLMSVDDMVDRTMSKLSTLGELDNTLVIFTSDNGIHWGEHRYTSKFTPYIPSVKVPMLVRWPGRVAAGSASDAIVANIDLKPTILEAAHVSADTDRPVDGRSLITGARRRHLLLEYWYDAANGPNSPPDWAATLTPTYEYVENYLSSGAVFREYYNLIQDPWQLTNLYGDGNATNNPPSGPLSTVLTTDRGCKGSACP